MLTIQPKDLEAARLGTSEEQLRYYLNGVNVQELNGKIALIATNGHILIKIETESPCESFESFILPNALIDKTLKLVKILAKENKHYAHFIRLEIDSAAKTIRLVKRDNAGDLLSEHDSIAYSPVDGTFPDWQRVMPKEAEAIEVVGITPAYVSIIGKAAAIHAGVKACHLRFEFTGPMNPMRINAYDGFEAVLMPVRI